jgi:hypothetical protein
VFYRAAANRNILVSLSLLAALLLPTFAHAQTSAFSFVKNHSLWDTGADIQLLQQFLNAQGFVLAHSGVGSPGHETTTFGPLTYRALVQFQAAHALPATGFFGPLTRTLTNDAVASNGGVSFSATSGVSAPSASSQSTAGAATSTASTTPPLPGYAPGQIIFIGGGTSNNNNGGGGGGGGGSSASPADTTAPSAPTNLSATVISSSQINLSWSASTDNVGVAGYTVFRDGTRVGTTASTNFADTGLSPSTLHSYWVAAYDASNNVSTSSLAASAETGFGADQYGTTWKPLRIGAGGYVTGIDIAADGTKVVRTDTYGAYLWVGSQWQQLVTSQSMPSGDVIPYAGAGVYEIRIAPSNTSRLYMEYNGYVYRSDNRGATWTKTSFAQVTDGSNDAYRTYGRKIAVDPANPDVVYAGSPSSGLFVSTNAGASWSQISSLGTSTSAVGFAVAFDPTSSVVGGKTQGIYAAAYGTGAYHSTDGGATWTLTSGTPTTFQHMVVAQDGMLYLVADDASNNLHIYSSGAWSSVSVGNNGNTLHAVAVDQSNPNRIVVAHAGGDLSVSTNHAASFTGYSNDVSLTATDIPWLSTSGTYLSSGNIEFDPAASNTLYQSAGAGVWKTNPSNTNTSVAFTSQSLGIEQLVAHEIISPPGGQPIVANWDFGDFYVANPDVFPSAHGTVSGQFAAGWSLDYASNNPNVIVALTNWGSTDVSGISTDGGQTWTQFAAKPTDFAFGGSIAAASSTDILWFPSDNNVPAYTTNGGQTWTPISMSGVPTTGETGWGFAYYLNRQIVAADRINIGTFYAYNSGPGQALSAAGVYKSTDGGATWAHIYNGEITYASGFNARLKTVPGIAGDLFFTGGPQSTGQVEEAEAFMHSTNGGATWNAVPNVNEVYDFGFGKAAAGTTTPAIYIIGWVNHQYGIYESDDGAQTWTQIGLWPFGNMDSPETISGDMNAYGRVYIGFAGSGSGYGNTANAQIPPVLSSISSGSPTTTSATITWSTDQSSNSKVVYGTTNAYGSVTSNASLVTSHTVSLTGLSSGVTYHYAAVSANAQGYTATSTDQTFTTFNSTPPSVPTGLTATATSSSEIDLSWNASTGNGSFPIAGYQIFRNGSQVGTTTSGTIYADTGLTPATMYSYMVDAYDTVGNVSAQSGSVSTTTQGGIIWTNQTASGARAWQNGGIAMSSDGTKLAAITCCGGYIYTSTDSGGTWATTTAPNMSWAGIVSSSDGTKLAASIGAGGYIYLSTNSGASWTLASDSPYTDWRPFSLASSADGTKLVAMGFARAVSTSTDSGATWHDLMQFTATSTGADLTSSSDGTHLAISVYNGDIWTSANSGSTWTDETAAGTRFWSQITSSGDGTKIAAIVNYGGPVYVSTTTGATWTNQGGANAASIAYSSDGSTLVEAVSGGYIYVSTNDGVTWIQQTSAGTSTWNGVAVSSAGTKIAVTASGGDIWTGVYTP